jgi:hypothetical protein
MNYNYLKGLFAVTDPYSTEITPTFHAEKRAPSPMASLLHVSLAKTHMEVELSSMSVLFLEKHILKLQHEISLHSCLTFLFVRN